MAANVNFGPIPVAAAAAAENPALAADVNPNAFWGEAADESFKLAKKYWDTLLIARTQWNVAARADNVAAKVAELKKLPYFVDLVPRGGSRKRRQSKKRRNHKNHNNNQ